MIVPSEELSAFQVEDYKAALSKVAYSVEDLHRTEIYIVIALVAFYSWMIKEGNVLLAARPELLWLAVPLPVLAVARLEFRYRYLRRLEEYLQQWEAAIFGAEGTLGWERFSNQSRLPQRYRAVRMMFWGAILIGTLVLPSIIDIKAAPETKPAEITAPAATPSG
jgi:hypothetical protein